MSMNMSGSGSGSGRENTCCVERRSFHYCSILGAFFSILEMETSIEASWDIRRWPFPPCLFLSFPFLFHFPFHRMVMVMGGKRCICIRILGGTALY